MQHNRAIVIGAGISGLFTAYYLQKEGMEVTVMDKDSGEDNCSFGNAGMIVPSHIIPLSSPGIISKGLKWMMDPESPFYIRPRLSLELLKWGWTFKKYSTEEHVNQAGPVLRDLLLTNRELLIELEEAEGIDFGFEKKGLFMFCNTEYGLKKEIEAADKANELGIPAKTLSAEEVQKMDPNLELDIVGATYYPKDAHLHPGSLMQNLKSILKENGAEFSFQTKIENVKAENGRVVSVTSNDGQIWKGDHFIICSGIGSVSVAQLFGKKLLMLGGKGYSITLQNPGKKPAYCGILSEKKVTMTPMYNSLRFAGTMELTGNNKKINQKKITGLKKSVCEYLPDFERKDLDGHEIWTGLRPCSPDGLPYVGSFNGFSNLYTSTGQAMMGMSLAASCAKIVKELIVDQKSDLYSDMIDPNRFG